MSNPPPLTAANFEASMRHNGFAVIDTGGGCTAWCRQFPTGRYVLVTNEDTSHTIETDCDRVVVGAYGGDNDPITGGVDSVSLDEAAETIVTACQLAIENGMKATDTNMIVEDAINAAAKSIQDALGVQSGDTAGIFFTGNNHESIDKLLREYATLEISLLPPSFEVREAPGSEAIERPRA